MSMCLVALDQHPEQKRLVATNPSLIPAMTEEVLRWSTIAQVLRRHVVVDTELAGSRLAAGDVVYLVLGAANRDPSRWPDADRFDISRAPKTHLGFGHGAHLCLGIHLARLEARIGLERLLAVAPDFRLRDVSFHGTVGLRGPDSGTVVPGKAAPGSPSLGVSALNARPPSKENP